MTEIEIATTICELLQSEKHTAVFAGGCVRDMLSSREYNDIDIATSLSPDDVIDILKNYVDKIKEVGKAFGVVLVEKDGYEYEIATYRKDTLCDGRKAVVEFSSMEEDAKRRDFTMNAVYYDPISKRYYDFVSGIDDIKKNRLRFVGSARDRIKEDYLRILRYFRFKHLREYDDSENRIVNEMCVDLLKFVSPERVVLELRKILKQDVMFTLISSPDLFEVLFPEVMKLNGVKQNPEYHKEGDALMHSIMVFGLLNEKHESFLLQIAGLFHDTGKAYCSTMENGRIISHGHEKKSTEIVEDWMTRFKFSNDDIEYVTGIVSNHMKFHQSGMSNATLRKLVAKPYFTDLILHVEADISCGSKSFDILNEYKDRIKKLEESKLPDKLVTGKDLIDLGMKPSEEFGKILSLLYDAQLNGEFDTKEEGINYFLYNGIPFGIKLED